ncbi:MAG: peptide deformylase [Candidatus Omnitrophica bacterium]|nr:peptide deformylase [Candidatus Omnitrophota bacterium]
MKETELKIRVIGEHILRKKAGLVKKGEINDEMRLTLSRMARLMYKTKGVGLAAQQAGIDKSITVIDAGTGIYKLINPKIVSRSGSESMEEGCLSIPGVFVKVKRAGSVVVEALDEYGQPLEIKARGLLARALQHEIDHLNGKLIIDHLDLFNRMRLKGKIKELAKYGKLSESED